MKLTVALDMGIGEMDNIEFYLGGKLFARIKSSFVLPVGSLINIRKYTYTVVRVTFALDHADDPYGTSMRCNIDLRAMTGGEDERL